MIRSRSEEHVDGAADSDSEGTNRSVPATGSDIDDEISPDSEGVGENGNTHHGHTQLRRSVTEPLDSGVDENHTAAVTSSSNGTVDHDYWLPTLPRFPVAQAQNKSCWSEPDIDLFRVRGPDYLSSKKKVKIPSEKYLLEARGLDFFVPSKEHPIDSLVPHTSKLLGGTLRMKPSLIVNFNFPWGLLIQYYEIPQKFAHLLQDPPVDINKEEAGKKDPKEEEEENDEVAKKLAEMTFDSPAERLFAKWLISDNDYKNSKLKLIPHVEDGPWAARSAVKGKPALIGMKLPIQYQMVPGASATAPYDKKENPAPFLLVELDIGNSSKAAKKIVGVCKRYMASLTVDIGFVIEGSHETELPEQMMGCVRVHEVDTKRSMCLF